MSRISVSSFFGGSSLSTSEKVVLRAMAGGSTLKVHRDLDGDKRCLLHGLEGQNISPVEQCIVESLARKGLIASNMKFPASTFLLTARGIRAGGGARTTQEVAPLPAKKDEAFAIG